MSNYAKILCYPEQLPPAIIHQIRREDMSMSGQASNMTFSDSAIQRAVIERVFAKKTISNHYQSWSIIERAIILPLARMKKKK